jgi:zinc-ribbon family
MIVIYGFRNIDRETAHGDFFCPKCKQDVIYSARHVRRWFTLFLVPVFPCDTVGRFVRCRSCAACFKMEILFLSRNETLRLLGPWTCDRCGWSNASNEKQCVKCKKPPQAKPSATPATLMPIVPPGSEIINDADLF